MPPTVTIYYGAVVNPKTLRSYQVLPRCLLAVSGSGVIEWVEEDVVESMVQETLSKIGYIDCELIHLKWGEFIMPGFVDTHTHAPQFPNLGSGQQYGLFDWLSNIIFPTEAKFSDVQFARQIYESVVRRTINSGTTTCAYYGTLHLGATKVLADVVYKYGQRALVGKCNMDRHSPADYIESSPDESLKDTKALITHIRSIPSTTSSPRPLVYPVLTPRFAISCTPELLSLLGGLASSDSALHIQTHISENKSEVAFTKELFPGIPTYAGVYDQFGLLRENTILAHGIYLEEAEMRLIKERNAGISHCPTSNFNLSSGIAKVGELLDRGIKVGLGTDVSGGFSPSILTAIQHASIASKVLAMQYDPISGSPALPPNIEPTQQPLPFTSRQLPVSALFYLATLGGAQVCCLADHVGSLDPGKSFDALLVSVQPGHRNHGLWDAERTGDNPVLSAEEEKKALEKMLETFLFCGDDRNISHVYVQGKRVGGSAF